MGRMHLFDDAVGIFVVAPSLNDQFDGVLNKELCDLSGGLIQDETKVVLGEHTVRRVRGIRVVENLVLIVVVDHSFASFVKD